MNQRFRVLQELGEQFERATEASQFGEGRSSGRTRLSGIGFSMRTGSRRLWAVVGVTGGAVIAGVLTAVLLLSAGTPAAYAGWTPVPSTASPAALATAVAKCYQVGSDNTVLGQPVLTEARDESTAAIYVIDGTVHMCLYDAALPAVSSDSMGPLRAAPGTDQLSVPYAADGGSSFAGKLPHRLFRQLKQRPLSSTRTALTGIRDFDAGDGYGYWVLGQAGSGISAVTFNFPDAKTVVASVQNGWYFAWWPWESDPTSVTVTARTGTTTSPMGNTAPRGIGSSPSSACQPGSSGCVFVNTPPAPATTTPASGTVATATRDCDEAVLNMVQFPADAFAGQPVLTDIHGIFTALFNVTSNRLYGCLIGGNKANVNGFYVQSIASFGHVRAAPGPDQLSVPYVEQGGSGAARDGIGSPLKRATAVGSRNPTPAQAQARREWLTGGGYGPYALGQAGSDVSAVTITFANGKTVAATVQNGWYFAWWPWTSDPSSVTVTTNSGTTTSPLTGSNAPRQPVAPGCQPGSSGCVFAQTSPTASTTTTTTAAPTPTSTTTTTTTTATAP